MIAPHAPWWADTELQEAADAFARRYAERSGVTVETLREWGRFPEPCDCGSKGCEGFVMNFAWEDAMFERIERSSARRIDTIVGGADAWGWCEDVNCPMQAEGQHVH